MYTPKIPNMNDPYDREWLAIVAIYLGVVFLIIVFNVVVNPYLQ